MVYPKYILMFLEHVSWNQPTILVCFNLLELTISIGKYSKQKVSPIGCVFLDLVKVDTISVSVPSKHKQRTYAITELNFTIPYWRTPCVGKRYAHPFAWNHLNEKANIASLMSQLIYSTQWSGDRNSTLLRRRRQSSVAQSERCRGKLIMFCGNIFRLGYDVIWGVFCVNQSLDKIGVPQLLPPHARVQLSL